MKIDDDETEEDDFLRSEEKSACLAKHNAESLLQRMFMKMTKIGEDEMAGKVGDAISSLYEIKRTRRRKKKSVKSIGDEKKKKKDARRRSASTSEEEEDDDDDDDERTIELKAVACSQIGAEATQRNPEVQTFRMRKNKEVEVCVHESSWSDAGLAFRIWGAARVAFRVVDFASEYFIEKEKTCLELGSGCGLIGAAIASLDGGRCTVTEGAPGALAALRKTALGVNEASKKESMKVAFLDWRDDLAALEEEKNGTVECILNIVNIASALSTKSPTPSFSPYSTCNFVHANKATFENAHVNMRLQDDARFDCLVGSDLMYDRQHCTALAASVARRLRPNGEAIIFLAVRSEELLIAFGKKCARRGLSVGVYAPTKPHEDLEDFTGGHANRPLPESCNEYWDLVAEKFSTCLLSKDYALFAPLLSSSSSLKDEDETSARRITLEGRFAMVRVVVAEKEEEKEQKQQQEVESEENDDESLKGVPVGDVKSMRVKL